MSFGRNIRGSLPLSGFCAIFLVTVLIPVSARAQSNSTPPPKWDIFAGYQWLHPGATVPVGIGGANNPGSIVLPDMAQGFGGAFAYNFDPHWALELDGGYDRDGNTSSSDYTISFGPRFMWRADAANFFVHVLGGYNNVTYNLSPARGLTGNDNIGAIMGGGMDIPFAQHFAWRVFEADYEWTRHDFSSTVGPELPDLRRVSFEGVRLRTGIVYGWGGEPAVLPAASCSVQPTEVIVGEPITATVSANNFNPKHTVNYSWSGTGGQVAGKDTTANIDTNNIAPGNYSVSAHVTDPRARKNNTATCTANFTVKPLPPKNPPTMSVSANPTELPPGGSVNLSASCTSPDNVPVSVADWSSSAGSVSGSGTSAALNTAGLPPGPITVTATCTDSRGLSTQANTQVTIQNPPPPPVNKELEARLALHSVYFPTSQPSEKDPNGGLLPSQQKTLLTLATDFKQYLQAKPDAHLILEGHADPRGSDALNQALSERRAARVKGFLVEQGVPESDIETKAYGKQRTLTVDEVKESVNNNPDLTPGERNRELARINLIVLASDRRVDVTLNTAGQSETSVRQFPFNSTDALSLIGGRESEMKKPVRHTVRKPAKKQ